MVWEKLLDCSFRNPTEASQDTQTFISIGPPIKNNGPLKE